jgi:hypothetical protein
MEGSGSPSPGRPVSSRQKIAERLLENLSEVWAEHGKAVLTKLAVSDPATLTRVAYGLVPRDILIGIEQRLPGNIGQDDWAALTKLAAVMKETLARGPADAPRCQVCRANQEHRTLDALTHERVLIFDSDRSPFSARRPSALAPG